MPVVSRSHPPLHVNPVNGSVFPPIQQGEVYKTTGESYLKITKEEIFLKHAGLAHFHIVLSDNTAQNIKAQHYPAVFQRMTHKEM